MNMSVYDFVKTHKRKYPWGISWRLKANSSVIERHLNPNEKVLYAFAAQKNASFFNIFSTFVIAVTNTRLLIGQKRLLWGYFYTSITPDLFNDLKVISGLLWGRVEIDTVKEFVELSKIDKRALDEIETTITVNMIKQKKKYFRKGNNSDKDDNN